MPLCCRHSTIFACDLVLHQICLIIEIVDCPDQHIVRNVIEMTAILQPWTSHRDVIRCTFSFYLDQQTKPDEVGSFPEWEWLEQLQSLGSRTNDHIHSSAIFRRWLVTRIINRKSAW